MYKKYNYEYVTVNIPSDCAENEGERANLAFLSAEDMFMTYKIPCVWYVVWDDGENVRVCRKSNKRNEQL